MLRALVEERVSSEAEQRAVGTAPLAALLFAAAREGASAETDDESLLRALGWSGAARASAGELLGALLARVRTRLAGGAASAALLDFLLARGPLAARLLRAAGPAPTHARLARVYGELADCLAAGGIFGADA
jgi:hypothetical protein